MTVSFRPMTAADRDFVISGWSASLRTSIHAGLISDTTWADVMHREIGAILDRPTTRTVVACEPGELDHLDREFLYGFAVARIGEPYLYYCYVKAKFRHGKRRGMRRGYGELLLDAVGIDPAQPFGYACRTPAAIRLAPRYPAATWDPFPARKAA